MKKLYLLLFIICIGCGGNLSDEQRKKFREGMEREKIVRITDAEIMSAALDKGHLIMKSLEAGKLSQAEIDSLAHEQGVTIHFTIPGSSNALAIEQELIEAYITGITTGSAQENIQKVYVTQQKDEYDSVLYTKPKVTILRDGTEQLDGLWNIYINKKNIVLDITKSK